MGNPQAVRVWTGNTALYGSKPIQKPHPCCPGGVYTRTGHKPTVSWPGFTYSEASFSPTQIFGSNEVLDF